MKAYWVCVYEKIENAEKLKEYAVKAKPAHNPSIPSIKLNEFVKPITQNIVNTTLQIPVSILGRNI